jgi:mannose-1-phosphate guanylyltransferase
MDKNYFCVIMAGGVGARFWPMSRTSQPKQFIDILGTGESLLQRTFQRFLKICPTENIFIATNSIYRDLVKEQLPEIADSQILCEPSRRNTAPCIAYANYKIHQINPNATIVVAPSDHVITKEDEFANVILSAMEAATHNNWLITLGIQPSNPNTGYGYIQFDENEVYAKDNRLKKVKTFTEKPELEMAKQFLQSGDFLWNAGIFIWKLENTMKAFKQFLPEIDELFESGLPYYNKPEEAEFIEKTYPMCKNISIDYGVMEKAENVYVLSSEFGWSDLGTWGSLYEHLPKDKKNNAVVGRNVMLYHSQNNIVNMPKDKVAVIQGLDSYIVAEDSGILLICKKEDEQQIRQFVTDVQIEKGEKYV